MKSILGMLVSIVLFAVIASVAHADAGNGALAAGSHLTVGAAVRSGEAVVYDSTAPSVTLTGSTPHTFIGGAANLAGTDSQVDITSIDMFMGVVAAASYTNVRARIQFWDTYTAGATPVFSTAAGAVIEADLGPLNLTGGTAYTVTLNLPTPLHLNSLANVGFGVSFQGDTGSGLAVTDNLTSALSYGGAYIAGSSAISGGNGFYRNASGRTDFNFVPTDLRTFTGITDVRPSLVLRKGTANQAPLILTATPDVLNPGATSQLSVSGGSGSGTVTYSVDSGPCTIAGSVVTANAIGTCVAKVTKAADGTFNEASATASISVVTPPPPTLAIHDGIDFARYGQTIVYEAALINPAAVAINDLSVMFTLSSGLDAGAAQWACSGAGVTCTQDPGNPQHYTVTVPAHGRVNWQIGVPVRTDTTDLTVILSMTAGAATPVTDTNGLVIFRDGFDGEAAQNPVSDSGFEESASGGGSWASTSALFGTTICSSGCGDGGGTAGPHGGEAWAWFDGSNMAEESSVSQAVTIPSGGSQYLNFWLWISKVGGSDAKLSVAVDGIEVAAYLEPATDEAGYTQRSVDISAYADGGAHLIEFHYRKTIAATSSYSLDDVTIDETPAPVKAPVPPVSEPTGSTARQRH